MDIPDIQHEQEHEKIIKLDDEATGLRGYLVIHSTALGPALGGVRILPYERDEEALTDALRLSRGMTYKCALAELPCGGGKTTLILHDGLKRREAFEKLGEIIGGMKGEYFTGGDVGITSDDLAAIRAGTENVACESSHQLGDINEVTARGVWHGMRACLGITGIEKARVAVQGAGNVGRWLAKILTDKGMTVLIADIDAERAEAVAAETGASVVSPDEVMAVECDVFAPCALGAVANEDSIPKFKAKVICGSANNVLATPGDGDALARRGILYAPDYLVNAGGVIRGAEFYLLKRQDSTESVAKIYDRMKQVAALAVERGVSTARVADELAEARFMKPRESEPTTL